MQGGGGHGILPSLLYVSLCVPQLLLGWLHFNSLRICSGITQATWEFSSTFQLCILSSPRQRSAFFLGWVWRPEEYKEHKTGSVWLHVLTQFSCRKDVFTGPSLFKAIITVVTE